MQSRFCYIFGTFVLVFSTFCSCSKSNFSSPAICLVDSLVWYSPDSTIQVLETMDTMSLSAQEASYRELMLAYARFRLNPDTLRCDVEAITQSFLNKRMYACAGEAYYIMGVSDEFCGELYSAMQHLKYAEDLLSRNHVPAEWLGATLYKMGSISESEQLYDVAKDYYLRSLPYLEETELYLFRACCYRDLARNSSDEFEKKHFMQAAIEQASKLSDPRYYYELQYISADSDQQLVLNHLLVDSLSQYRYAHRLVSHYLENDNLDIAQQYMEVFARDTLSMDWSRNRWHYLHAYIYLSQGKLEEAFEELDRLYRKETADIEASGKSRTYAIARRYDLALEQERNLQLTIRQQHAYLLIGILIIGLLILGIVLLVQYQRRRIATEKIVLLNQELEAKRDALRRVLTQRIELAQQMQLQNMRHMQQELPSWVQSWLSDSLWERWTDYQNEFNGLYNNLLIHLKEEHPALTITDLQIISLMVMNLSISDICLLLNQSKNTIWSRRLRIKHHAGLTQEDDLDDWVKNQVKKHQQL